MYLETILILSRQNPNVRSIDVVDYMGYSKPSVSRAVSLLKNGGYLEVNPGGILTLTEIGKEIAENIYDRHQILSRLLMSLGVDEKTAVEDACKIEHDISPETFSALKQHVLKHTED